MSELSEHLAELPDDFDHETWTIDSPEKASWAMKKLRVAREKKADIQRQYEDELARMDYWREKVSKNPTRDETFFENQLKAYMLRVRDEETKSLVLPDGEISSRSIPDRAQVSNKELFLKWAANNERGGWIRTKEEVDLSALKDEVDFEGDFVIDKKTGEIIEGLVRIESDISVTVSVATGI